MVVHGIHSIFLNWSSLHRKMYMDENKVVVLEKEREGRREAFLF